jgi:hypothetical protein
MIFASIPKANCPTALDPYVKQCGATLKQLEAMRSTLVLITSHLCPFRIADITVQNEQLDRLFDPLKQLVDGMESKSSMV